MRPVGWALAQQCNMMLGQGPTYKLHQGFSLLECLFVLAIMGILATIAYPSYLYHITRAHRVDGHLALYHMASLLESYYVEHHTYQHATIMGLNGTDQSYQKHYTLRLVRLTSKQYTLSATPNDSQGQQDKTCQTLTLNQSGQKGINPGPLGKPQGSIDECWS